MMITRPIRHPRLWQVALFATSMLGGILSSVVESVAGDASFAQPADTRWSRVERWLIEYETEVVFGYAADARLVGRTVHKVVAFAKPDLFYHFMGHGKSWKVEPFNQLALLEGNKAVHFRPSLRRMFEQQLESDVLPGTLTNDAIFLVVPRLASQHFQLQDTSRKLISEAINSENFEIYENPQFINGQRCVLLKSLDGSDRIWIDQNREMCLLQREFRDVLHGQLLHSIETQETMQVADGLWMPSRFMSSFYEPSYSGDPQLLRQVQFRILRCDINENVPDRVFSSEISPGTLQLQLDGTWKQVISGGTELLDEYVDYLQSEILADSSHVATAGIGVGLLRVGIGALVTCLLLFAIFGTSPTCSCPISAQRRAELAKLG